VIINSFIIVIIIIIPFSIFCAKRQSRTVSCFPLLPDFSFLIWLPIGFNCTCRRSRADGLWSFFVDDYIVFSLPYHKIFTLCNCLIFVWDYYFYTHIIYLRCVLWVKIFTTKWLYLRMCDFNLSVLYDNIYKIMLKMRLDTICSKK